MKLVIKKCLSTAALAVLVAMIKLNVITFIGTVGISIYISWLITDSYFRRVSWESDLRIDPKNKAVLITGCDTGFGHNLAINLATYGFNVYATVLSASSDGALKLKNDFSNVRVIQMDVTSDEDVNKAVNEVESFLGADSLVAIVNNAGYIEHALIELCPMVHYTKQMDINSIGLVRVTKAFLPLLRRSKKIGSRIVLVGSAAGRYTATGFTAYSMTKYAVRSFADGLRKELVSSPEWKMSVSVIEPLCFATNMCNKDAMTKVMEENSRKIPAQILDSNLDQMSNFSQIFDQCLSLVNQDINEVVDTMAHIVTTRHEVEPFYRIGRPLERLLIYANEILPESITDMFVPNELYMWKMLIFCRNTFGI